MLTLATTDDVQYRIGRDLTSPELARIGVILQDVSAAIRREARQQITSGTSTIRAASTTGRLVLPQWPVVSIDSVQDYNAADVTYTWVNGWSEIVVDSSLLLNSWEIEPFRYSNPSRPLTVEYTHGYETVPDDLVGVAANMAARAFGMVPSDSGVTSESLGSYSVSYGSAAAAGGFGMLDAERAIVRAYRRPSRPIAML